MVSVVVESRQQCPGSASSGTARADTPASLAEAHEVLCRLRPRTDADPRVWARFHRHSAEVYANTAKVDERHQHEATHWAGAELRRAREIEDRLDLPADES
jgi:hypothetical protein